jgi:hypothetical protein
MPLATSPRQAERLINYLNANGGSESTVFVNDDGSPNIGEARVFAEKLRLIHKKYSEDLIKIVQEYNKVTITVTP